MIPIIQNPPYIFPCRLLTMSLHKGEGICLLLMKHSSQCSRTLDQLMTVRILTGLQIQQTVLTCRFQIPKVVECILWKNKFKTVVKQLQSSGGSKGGACWAQASPLFLDQTEARKGENTFFRDRPQPLSEGLGPLLACTKTWMSLTLNKCIPFFLRNRFCKHRRLIPGISLL